MYRKWGLFSSRGDRPDRCGGDSFDAQASTGLSFAMMKQPTVVELTRTVRFSLRGDGTLEEAAPRDNTYAGWPPMVGLGRYFELHVTCRGAADPQTGYFINITQIDHAARRVVLPMMSDAAQADEPDTAALMRQMIESLQEPLDGTVARLALQLTPAASIAIEDHDMDHVLLSHQYDFSAAHRLHSDALSEEENRRVFGKCNNPSGHGHNYQLEVTVRAPLHAQAGSPSIGQLDHLVDRVVIQRFDHRHLNIDTEEFAEINPSVENIARVCYELLLEEVRSLGVELAYVRVWETPKTICTYPASA
jgi:6-pyruvoyltetrahydropterin/6-carboxytetrahydropterin synthase